MLCSTLTGLFRKSASQPVHEPPVHTSASGKAVSPSLPGSSPLPSSQTFHTTPAEPAVWASCTSLPARNCALSPVFPDHSSSRSRASRPNIPEDMCSSSLILHFAAVPAPAGIPGSRPITDYVNGNGTMESIAVLRKQSLRNLYESIGMP